MGETIVRNQTIYLLRHGETNLIHKGDSKESSILQ